ncbi:hypothetical protein LIA77_00452 [Sarocladium implicatum]|nr:hypothetical protein LIA77_00452 [Sarocladium implicatum]
MEPVTVEEDQYETHSLGVRKEQKANDVSDNVEKILVSRLFSAWNSIRTENKRCSERRCPLMAPHGHPDGECMKECTKQF